jgi:hypothetical protein
MCRPSCLTEAYGSPEKCWLVYVGLLISICSISTSFFLAMVYWRRLNERNEQILWMFSVASRSHSMAIDECRAARLA